MNTLLKIFLLLSLSVCAVTVNADTVQIPANKDNTMHFSNILGISNGAGPNLFVGNSNKDIRRRGLIAFDIAGNIPSGSAINNATLTLRMSKSIVGDKTVELKKLLADWGEGASVATGGGGSSATANDATWPHSFYPSAFWTSPGGDFTEMASADTKIGSVGFYSWGSTTILCSFER